MNRHLSCFAVLFLACCAVAAQSPSSDPAPGASPAGVAQGVTTTVSPEVAQFQKIEDSWSDAVNRRDQYALELVLSPLFVDVSAQGDVTTRNQDVVQVIGNQDKALYLTQKVITVRMLGDIAVTNGTYTLHHKLNSAEVDEKGVFTHVFERLRGGWVCINSQRTLIKEDAKSNGKTKKPSTAEEPFHIPLFSRSDKNDQQQ